MIVYDWYFDPLTCYQTVQGYDNVVMKVNLRLVGTSGSFYGQIIDAQELQFPQNTETFINFDNLTHGIVLGWVTASLGITRINEMKESIKQQIETEMSTPKIINLTPPWNTQTPIGST